MCDKNHFTHVISLWFIFNILVSQCCSYYWNYLFLLPLSFQHAFVTQLLTRNLVIELLDAVNNPDLQQTHTMDESDLEVN